MASNVTRDHHNLRRNLNLNGNYISNDGGDEGIRITDAGKVGINNPAPGSVDVSTTMEISKVSGNAILELSCFSTSVGDSGILKFQKSGIAAINTFGDGAGTEASEILGSIQAFGTTQDATPEDDESRISSYIAFANDAASREGGVPGKIIFATNPDSDNSVPAIRMTIDNDGKVGIGEDDPEGVLDVLNASITTTNLLDLSAVGLTTGSLVYGVGNSNPSNGGTSKLLRFKLFSLSTYSHTSTGMELDYNKNVITASGRTATINGLHIDMDDSVNNAGTTAMTGLDIDVDFAHIGDGTTTATGLNVAVAGADTNYAAILMGGNVGIGVAAPDSALEVLKATTQLKLSFDDTSFATITVADDSDTTITTGESGDLTLDPVGALILEGGSSIQMGTNFVFSADTYAMMWGGSSQQVEITSGNLQFTTSGNIDCNATGEIDFNTSTAGFTAQAATGDGTTTIDWTNGNKFHLLFAASTNEEITFGTNPTNPCNLLLKLKQPSSGAGCTANWTMADATLYWVGGGTDETGEPTLSTGVNDVDIITFYFDGTNYYGVASLGFDA